MPTSGKHHFSKSAKKVGHRNTHLSLRVRQSEERKTEPWDGASELKNDIVLAGPLADSAIKGSTKQTGRLDSGQLPACSAFPDQCSNQCAAEENAAGGGFGDRGDRERVE